MLEQPRKPFKELAAKVDKLRESRAVYRYWFE
jgi:hypothetical protein